jgi:hypothetical protein
MILKLNIIFNLNLMYPPLDEESRIEVIKNYYWPLYKIIELGMPIRI